MFIVGFLMSEIAFATINMFKPDSWGWRVLSGFHFVGILFTLVGMLEAYLIVKNEIETQIEENSDEV